MEKIKIYNHPDITPVWNYMQVIKTNDIRFLLQVDDYINFPEQTYKTEKKRLIGKKTVTEFRYKDEDLTKAWESINFNIENGMLNMEFENMKDELRREFMLWKAGEGEQSYNRQFAKVRQMMDVYYNSVKITSNTVLSLNELGINILVLIKFKDMIDREYATMTDMYSDLSSLFDYEETLTLRVLLIDLCEYKTEFKGGFIDELTSVENILGITIDPHNTSLSKYLSYRKKASEKVQKRAA